MRSYSKLAHVCKTRPSSEAATNDNDTIDTFKAILMLHSLRLNLGMEP